MTTATPAAGAADVPTLRELLNRIAADPALTRNRRHLLRTAVHSVVKHTGLNPETTKASFEVCRSAVMGFQPARVGMSHRWWSAVRSALQSAFRRYGGAIDHEYPARPLSPAWRQLRAKLPTTQYVRRLSRLIRWCDRSGIAPEDVTDETSDAFLAYVVRYTPVALPKKIHRETCQQWNLAVAEIPGWPQRRLTVRVYRRTFALPLERFPASFAADLDAWAAFVGRVDPLTPGAPRKPLRPATITHRRRAFRFFATALVRQGVPIEQITSLGVLVQPDNLMAGLRYFWEREGKARLRLQAELASDLLGLARYWAKAEGATLLQLQEINARFWAALPRGMTERTRTMLRQFDEPANVRKLVALPQMLAREAARARVPADAAHLMQMAVAIEILLVAPVRRTTLGKLKLGEHIRFAGPGLTGPAQLVAGAADTKKAIPVEFELPAETIALIRRYLRKHQPVLTRVPSKFLFPGPSGGAKRPDGFGVQIMYTIRRYTGLEVRVHDFRHIAAKLLLQKYPKQFHLVTMLLGHGQFQTAIDHYCELGTKNVALEYGRDVLGRTFGNA